MSREVPDTAEIAQLAYPCPFCGAQAGEWCRRKRGPRRSLHSWRWWKWRTTLD